MQRFALAAVVLAGCLSNPSVEVDQQSLEIPRGAATQVRVSLDGVPVEDLSEVLWSVDDEFVTVTRSHDGAHLRVGGDYEGETIVHVHSHGQDIAIPTRVGPPAIVLIWTEPSRVNVAIGGEINIRAKSLDTVARIEDITFTSRWDVRDESIVNLDHAGMMLRAMTYGETTLHVGHGTYRAVVPVAVFK